MVSTGLAIKTFRVYDKFFVAKNFEFVKFVLKYFFFLLVVIGIRLKVVYVFLNPYFTNDDFSW